MKFKCSRCQHLYKIQKDKLPKDKVAVFKCKNCGAKLQLDLRPDHSKEKDKKENLKTKILENVQELPPMPQVVSKTRELIADVNSDTKKIAEIIETDQGIAVKVLKAANSAFYGMISKISTVQQASTVLGYKTLGEIVTMAGTESILSRSLPGYGYQSEDLWKHSLAVSFGSKIIAGMRMPGLEGEAYTAGLIHDVGKIILDSYVLEQRENIDAFMKKEEKTFLNAEFQFFGFTHADIAFEVCKKWNFPDNITLAIKNHHQPSHSNGDGLSYILHIADYIALLSGIGYDDDDVLCELEDGVLGHFNFRQENISKIVLQVTEFVNKISEI
jgi:putative nucleotidyltransferase with HDIG domain